MSDALDQLEVLVRAEREAISALDSERVEQFSVKKEELFAQLFAQSPEHRQVHRSRLERVIRDLRQNGVLLAHARDILRDGLRAAAPRLNENSYLPLRRSGFPGIAISTVG